MSPTWLGSMALNEHPTSPQITQDATKTAITRIYEGPVGVCVSSQPTIGQTFSDLPGDVIVVGSTVMPAPGGTDGAKGRLTINMETPYATTFETEWVELDKALILHPRYWSTLCGNASDGVKPLDQTDRTMIEQWEHEDDAGLKAAFKFKVAQMSSNTTIGLAPSSVVNATSTGNTYTNYAGVFNVYTLSAYAQDYAAKRLKGEESYRVYAPVVRQTSESLDPPDAAACGQLQNPPTDSNPPDGYVWQQSANRVTRTGPYGKYRQQIEWQGVDEWDTDLYTEASPATAPNPPT